VLKLGSGHLADRLRRRKPLVLAGYGIAALARPLVALAAAPWHVLAVRVTDRIGKGIRTAPRDVLIATSASTGDTGRAFGFHRAMDHAGAVIGPLVATALLGVGWSLRSVFAFAIVPGVLAILAVLAVRERTQPPVAPSFERQGTGARGLPRKLRTYFLVLALFALGNSSDAFLLLRAQHIGVPVAALPLTWSVFHVTKLVSSYVGGSWSDRVPRHKLVIAGWLVYAATYVAFGFATEAWHAWALFVVYGCYYGLTEPAEKALVKDLAPEAMRGRAYGIYNFIVGVMAIPAGVLTGWIWQSFGAHTALSVGAALAAASSLALIVWAAQREAASQVNR
jgi:MFS family permease